MTEHCLIPGDFFTPEQWRGPLAPWIDRLTKTSDGMLLIAVDVAPQGRNYPLVSFAVFDAVERKALRAALLKVKKKREAAPSHAAPGRPRFVKSYRTGSLGGA